MNRRALLIGAAAALVILLLWYFLLWSPRNQRVSEAAARADTAEQQVRDLELQVQRLRALQREEPQKRARLELLRSAVPDEPRIGQFILEVNDAANQSGIDFMSISQTVPAGGVITVALTLQGGYFQVLDFINRLEDMSRLVVIDTVTFAPDAGGVRIAGTLSGKIFVGGVAPPTTVPGTPPPQGAPA